MSADNDFLTPNCDSAKRHRKMMSLERQVRVVAGGVGFHRALLGYFVNPAWIALWDPAA